MRKVLVTGGAGHVGGALASALARDGSTLVTVIDNLETSTRDKVPTEQDGGIRFVKGDVNRYEDVAALMTSDRFDFVFHYAALVGVARTLERPIDVLDDINGISNILRLAKNTGVSRVFYSSSSEVYGEPVEFPQNEQTTPLNSRLPYAIVKNVGEAFFRSFQREYGLEFTIFRLFNTYGPRQSSDFVISRFIRSALNNEPITIYGDGTQSRTFCYIDDNVDCTIACLNGSHAVNEVLNVGSEVETTINELARTVIDVTRSRSKVIHLPPLSEGDMSRRQPDNSKMKRILGRELICLTDGIARIVASMKESAPKANDFQRDLRLAAK